jgi:hypothetical protein
MVSGNSRYNYKNKRITKRSTRRNNKKTNRRNKANKRNKTQKGGTCYGSGVGANNFDPNWSIYNTRTLQLFPYKP